MSAAVGELQGGLQSEVLGNASSTSLSRQNGTEFGMAQ